MSSPFDLTAREREILRYRPTQIRVNLEAIKENIRRIKELVAPSLVAVVVKGNAYGHGMSAVSLALKDSQADALCVATPESAFTLRKRGVELPIFLLSEPPLASIQECYEQNITMCAYSQKVIDAIAEVANSQYPAHVHIKVDTGMNRIGCEPEEVMALSKQIASLDNVFLEGIFTHFATADEENSNKTIEQFSKFNEVLEDLKSSELLPPIVHAANSAAAITFPESRFSMVRIGAACYGGYPADHIKSMVDLEEAIEFSTEIMFLKSIKAGESVSYGAHYIASAGSVIATIPAGYSDGIPRSLGLNGGEVLIKGVRCPIIGAITMDMMMIDVGNLDVSVGDKVVLLGSQGNEKIIPDEWAKLTGTIRYEIISSMGERLPRIYD